MNLAGRIGPQTSIRLNTIAHANSTVFDGRHLPEPLEDKSVPVLYTHVLCPYAQRAWMALSEKGVDFKLVNIDLSSKPQWYTRLNPVGLVPAVAFEGTVQTESLDICRWIDSAFDGPPLVLPGKEEDTKILIGACRSFSSAGLNLLAGSTGRSWGIGDRPTDSQRQDFSIQLEKLAQSISCSGGPFLTGKQPSLADIVYYPFAERFELAMPVFCGLDFHAAGNGAISRWLQAMQEREAITASMADRDLLLEALRNYRSLDFFDFHTYDAAALHPHLRS